MKKHLVVAVDVKYNDDDNPYPIIDETVKLPPKAFNSYDGAYEYSELLFSEGKATNTLVIPFIE